MPIVPRLRHGRGRVPAGLPDRLPDVLSAGLFALLIVAMAACSGEPVPSGSPSPTTIGTPGASPVAAGPTCPPPAPGLPPDSRWWVDRVFYEVFVRSFADSDGDGIGDLRGLTERLDYLNDGDPATHDDLGVTALWLMPVAESPSDHGYDVTDYRTIESDYGTNDDFRAFMTAAHERGIGVVVDFVVNHTSVQHPWFVDARTSGSAHDPWYVWSAPPAPFNGPSGQVVWHPSGERLYYGFFWDGMPDLNLSNPAVTAELADIARFWLDELGVDGFRLDAAQHLIEEGQQQVDTGATHAWLNGFRDTIHAVDPEALVLGEVFNTRFVTASYIDSASLDLVFDFDLAGTIRNAVRLGDANTVLASLEDLGRRYPAGGVATFLSNHDQNRIMSELRGDTGAARSAAAILLTSPGAPFLYYGEEVGLQGRKPDPDIRTPLPWTGDLPGRGFTTGTPWAPFAPGADAATVATQDDDPASLLSAYRQLIALRATSRALSAGSVVRAVSSSPSVAAWLRVVPDGDLALVIHNLSDDDVAGVRISLPPGTLCGTPSVVKVSSVPPPAGGVPSLAVPVVAADGGVVDYAPLATLPARSTWVIQLNR